MDIREFYELFPYPPRPVTNGRPFPAPPSDFVVINHYVFGGRWNRRLPFRVLIAGCGTGLGATALASQLAGLGVLFEMLCIDVSDASLKIARERAEREGIAQYLTFQRRPIEDLEAEPVGVFDYVDLSGVINHVEDPVRVAAVLHRVLADPGGIGVMAYGALGRTGIYPVQDMLRQLGLATKESVPEARALLRGLPDSNWLKRNPILADNDSISDAEFADRYLNPRDRAFSVRDLEELFGGAGFDLRAFLPPIVYDAKAMLSSEENRRRVDRLANVEKWHMAEQMQGSLHNHSFEPVAE
jgi:SAM-dependent methyltransferase